MTEIYEFDGQISKDLNNIEQDLNKFNKSQNSNILDMVQKKLRVSKGLILAYEQEIESADEVQAIKYKQSLEKLRQQQEKLSRDLELKRAQLNNTEGLFNKREIEMKNQQQFKQENNKQFVIEKGDQAMNGMLEAVENIERMNEEIIVQADNIILTLDQQIKQLDNLKVENEDISTLLKRSEKQIRYFQRALQTDKLLRCCLILVFLSLLIVVILAIWGKGEGKFGTSDTVQREN